MRAAAGFMALAVALLSLSLSGLEQNAIAAPPAGPKALTPPPPEARVDINRATLAELFKVPGLTHSWANRIVRFRPYRTKQDLLDRGVLSGEVYDRIKEYVIAHRDTNQSLKPVRKHEGDGPKPVPFMQFHNSE
ncbi:MAG: helix-hairpin-helix domain-containing protein [Terracidiphilus sp.]|nr:helix-hairpin-helix domain-containing protein [Terracidiphilus sp.]MDR3777337.1 helix-hairpin-helix domain-containing protein [Terracidiphilus sp.]